jgi:GNAT superfamily N-acetyltransferase
MMEANGSGEINIRGYYPGVIGRITEIHAVYYFDHWGFDVTFETQVGRELSDFISEFHEGRDGFWAALLDGKFAGSIAIDGRQAHKEGARLRWFIVPPQYQGQGIGVKLIERAVTFCKERGHRSVFLWTFEGLQAARALYERMGFLISKEHEIYQWGQNITEQMFVLSL